MNSATDFRSLAAAIEGFPLADIAQKDVAALLVSARLARSTEIVMTLRHVAGSCIIDHVDRSGDIDRFPIHSLQQCVNYNGLAITIGIDGIEFVANVFASIDVQASFEPKNIGGNAVRTDSISAAKRARINEHADEPRRRSYRKSRGWRLFGIFSY